MTFMRRMVAPAVGLTLLAGCSSTSPNGAALADFVTGVKGVDGTIATQSRGAPPAATGGPTLTATPVGSSSSSASVINGGSTLVQLRAASAFNQVFISVIDDPLDGFLTLTLPAATTDTTVIVTLGGSIPVNTFQTVFGVKTPSGLVGPATSIADTVVSGAATSYQGVWNVGHLFTAATGACASGSPPPFASDGQTTVSSSGSFTYGHFGVGTMNLSTGAWSFSGVQTGTPGNVGCGPADTSATFSASGTCSSFAVCSGTISITTSPSGGTTSGIITWAR